uniref:Uncharacterized protein n=1 Tax=Anguilla anguilla TaxID=7936 RepID=A0A0E9XIJ7_ANGAN
MCVNFFKPTNKGAQLQLRNNAIANKRLRGGGGEELSIYTCNRKKLQTVNICWVNISVTTPS